MPYLVDPQLWSYIEKASEENSVPVEAIAAIVETESGWVAGAIGDNGHSYGLMQLNDRGAGEGKDPATLLDPESNIHLGAQYLKRCMDATPDLANAFSAYNQGISGWQENGIPLNPGYVVTAMRNRDNYAARGIRARRGGEVLCAFDPYG